MKTAKIGAMFLISILALAGIGMGYASWTDTITIDGTVNTGSVDLVVVGYSGTWVYKNLRTDLLVESTVKIDDADHLYVASAWAEAGTEDDEVTITFDKLFPCIDFKANILFRYDGSIPVKITNTIIDISQGDDELVAMWQRGVETEGETPQMGAWIDWYWSDADGIQGDPISDDPNGIQIHNGDYILVVGHIHLPQEDDLMNKQSSFTATFEVIQWNKYTPQ